MSSKHSSWDGKFKQVSCRSLAESAGQTHLNRRYVEDQQVDAEALQRAFAQTRVPNELIILPDGESGRGYFESAVKSQGQIPSLTMIDLNLGKMAGVDLIKWIREQALRA